jgi:hypothetical protein
VKGGRRVVQPLGPFELRVAALPRAIDDPQGPARRDRHLPRFDSVGMQYDRNRFRGGIDDVDLRDCPAPLEEAQAPEVAWRSEGARPLGVERELRDHVGRQRGPADAVGARLDPPDGRMGEEERLDRPIEVGVVAQVAGVAVCTAVEVAQRGEDLARRAAARAKEAPAQFEQTGRDCAEAKA